MEASTSKTPRFKNTKWKSVSIDSVEVNKLDGTFWNKGMLDKKLTLPDGTELIYNDSAASLALTDILQSDTYPKDLRANMHRDFIKDKDFRVFYMDLAFLNSHLGKDWSSFSPLLTAGEAMKLTKTLTAAAKEFVNWPRQLYLRTFVVCAIDREGSRLMFLEELQEMIPILMRQQNDKVDEECEDRINEFFTTWKEKNADQVSINTIELKEILEHFDINKSQITLVPDMLQAYDILFRMSVEPGCPFMKLYGPDKRELVEVSQAIFRIFQEVVCDVNWYREVMVDPRFSGEAFSDQITAAVDECFTFNNFVPLEETEKIVATLKTNPNYLERKRQMLVTPLMKLYDCDFNDTTDLYFFLSECHKFKVGADTPPDPRAKNQQFPCWKFRLMFLSAWCDIFFPLDSHYHSIVRTGIFHRAPFVKWEGISDFEDLMFCKTKEKQKHARFLAQNSFTYFHAPKTHEWLKNTTWKDRTYINRCPKWISKELEEGKSDLIPNSIKFYNESLQNEASTLQLMEKLGIYQRAPEPPVPEQKPPAKQQAKKGKPTPTPRDCNSCETISQKNSKLIVEVKDLKAEYEKSKVKVAQAEKNVRGLIKKEKEMQPRRDVEREIRESKKRIGELEKEGIDQERKDTEFQKQLLAVQKAIEELKKKNAELEQFGREKDERIRDFEVNTV